MRNQFKSDQPASALSQAPACETHRKLQLPEADTTSAQPQSNPAHPSFQIVYKPPRLNVFETLQSRPESIVQSSLIVGKLELPEQFTQAWSLDNRIRLLLSSHLPIFKSGDVLSLIELGFKFAYSFLLLWKLRDRSI